jgi:hypothetical protein
MPSSRALQRRDGDLFLLDRERVELLVESAAFAALSEAEMPFARLAWGMVMFAGITTVNRCDVKGQRRSRTRAAWGVVFFLVRI